MAAIPYTITNDGSTTITKLEFTFTTPAEAEVHADFSSIKMGEPTDFTGTTYTVSGILFLPGGSLTFSVDYTYVSGSTGTYNGSIDIIGYSNTGNDNQTIAITINSTEPSTIGNWFAITDCGGGGPALDAGPGGVKLNSSGYMRAQGVKFDLDGNLYVVGADYNTGGGCIAKYDPTGSLLWFKEIVGPGTPEVRPEAVAVSTDGAYIFVGVNGLPTFAGTSALIAKFDNSGNLITSVGIGSATGTYVKLSGLIVDSLDNVACSCQVDSDSGTASWMTAIKYDSALSLVWQSSFNNTESNNVWTCTGIAENKSTGGYILIGNEDGNNRSAIIKMSNSGFDTLISNMQSITYPALWGDPYSVVTDSSGNIYVAYDPPLGNYGLAKINSSGSLDWQVNKNISGSTIISLAIDENDPSGTKIYTISYSDYATIVKHDAASGTIEWQRQFSNVGNWYKDTYPHNVIDISPVATTPGYIGVAGPCNITSGSGIIHVDTDGNGTGFYTDTYGSFSYSDIDIFGFDAEPIKVDNFEMNHTFAAITSDTGFSVTVIDCVCVSETTQMAPPLTPVDVAVAINLPTADLCTAETGLTNVINNVAWYSLALASTTSVTFDTEGSVPGTDTEIGVYDDAGNLLGSDDDSGTGYLSSLTLTDLNPGTYYIAVGYYNIDFGSTNWAAIGDTPATDDCTIHMNVFVPAPSPAPAPAPEPAPAPAPVGSAWYRVGGPVNGVPTTTDCLAYDLAEVGSYPDVVIYGTSDVIEAGGNATTTIHYYYTTDTTARLFHGLWTWI